MTRANLLFASLLAVPLVVGVAIACTTQSLQTSEINAVVTIATKDVSLKDKKTFALTPYVVDLCDTGGTVQGAGGEGGSSSSSCYDLDHSYDKKVLATIAKQLSSRGWTQVDSTADNPDIVVLAGAVAADYWYYSASYGWCDPFFDGACWAPSTSYSYYFPVGSLLISVGQPKDVSSGAYAPSWFAGMAGLYSTSASDMSESSMVAAVEQAFTQSKSFFDLSSSSSD